MCGKCGAIPGTEDELALSLVLSETLSSYRQLGLFAQQICTGQKLSIPGQLIVQAREAIRNPQFLASLRKQSQPADITNSERRDKSDPEAPNCTVPEVSTAKQPQSRQPTLFRNPFALLGATTRDNRRRIVELADEKSLELDHDACQKARSDLTSPRTRLSAEMDWLPGVSPRKAKQLLQTLFTDPMAMRKESGLPTLAHANLLAAAFETMDSSHVPDDVATFVQELAYLADKLSAEVVRRDINEDRTVSGFPLVTSLDQIETELLERRRHFRDAIKRGLNELPASSLVKALTIATDDVTRGGDNHAPTLIDDLVDSYAVEAQSFFQKEAENVHKLIQAARDSATSGESAVKPFLDKLETVVRNWDKIAQPIQLSFKARGIDHESSNELAISLRSLAVTLYNEHGMLGHSQRLTALMQELFAELPEVSDRAEQDAETLADIVREQKAAEARSSEYARDITYRAEVGLVFKDVLTIAPEGVSWNDKRYSLDSVTRIRWGGVRRSVNGIPTGTSYTLAFGDNHSEAVVELRKETIYSTFTEKLWRAVGVRLLIELLEFLKRGEEVRYGNATLKDEGVTFVKRKFFGPNELLYRTWDHVRIGSSDGSFYIRAEDDNKAYVGLSYIHEPNVHVLEQAIRMAFKKPGIRRLSDVLQ